MSITAGIRGTIQVTDNLTGSTSLTKLVNNFYTGLVNSYGQSVIVGIVPLSLNVPNGLAQFVYFKNLSPNQGTTLTVTWTPQSGMSATIISLDPGAMVLLSELTTSNGISAVSVVSNQTGTPFEYILAG